MNRENRGIYSETMVGQALLTIKNKGERSTLPPIIEIIHAKPNSSLDRQGVDYLIKLQTGHEIPLQVKSSTRAKRKFERHCKRFGKVIPVVVVGRCDHMSIIINRVWKSIQTVFNAILRQLNNRLHRARSKSLSWSPRKASRKEWCYRLHRAQMCH